MTLALVKVVKNSSNAVERIVRLKKSKLKELCGVIDSDFL